VAHTARQSLLAHIPVSNEERDSLKETINDICQRIKVRFKELDKFESVLIRNSSFKSVDVKDDQTPEEFTKQHIIKPLLDFIGYEDTHQTRLRTQTTERQPDYVIHAKASDFTLYVEAEPMNVDLNAKGHGINQIREWISVKNAISDYGIATDGFKWILVRFNANTGKTEQIHQASLKKAFIKAYNRHYMIDQDEIAEAIGDFLLFCGKNIPITTGKSIQFIEEEKEKISKRFYEDYVRFVFGVDAKETKYEGKCLLNTLHAPHGATEREKNLFAVVFMNRLLFIRFLEEKNIVSRNFLKTLYRDYRLSSAIGRFYDTQLKPLFYDVFNKDEDHRDAKLLKHRVYKTIPYLNGGLFRDNVPHERDYFVDDDGFELILNKIIEAYDFSGETGLDQETGLDPDILGYVFEKTINYIAGAGTNKQKMEGAYYTPDDVVQFIIENTLSPLIFDKMKNGLRKLNWTDLDFQGYDTIDDFFQDPPKSTKAIMKMVDEVKTLKILDPACGSGHFLTAILSHVLTIQESLLKIAGKKVDKYALKHEIISNNIFGVDLDENAVEIARLRLWLSLIEDVATTQHVKTLPNIDFNILVGNSLVGWLNEDFELQTLTPIVVEESFEKSLQYLNPHYPEIVQRIKDLLGTKRLTATIEAYNELIGTYKLGSATCADHILVELENIRAQLYESITQFFLSYLYENGTLTKKDKENLVLSSINERAPFNWHVDFRDVIQDGGFDIVIGNPPYVEDRLYNSIDVRLVTLTRKSLQHQKEPEKALFYDSARSGNTYAYFIERALKLLKDEGKLGFIVPLSVVSTDRMHSIRRFIQSNSSKVNYYNFDDRPGKLFSGLEHCRSTIILITKGRGTDTVWTTRYNRWATRDRDSLFNTLSSIDFNVANKGDIVPKIGIAMEKAILEKIVLKSRGTTLGDSSSLDASLVWYHNAPQYWIHAHSNEFVPRAEYYRLRKEQNGIHPEQRPYKKIQPEHYKSVSVPTSHAEVALGLMNSSLFYWWFILWSDCRDLLDQHIVNFPINLLDFPADLVEKMETLVSQLLMDLEANSSLKRNVRKREYIVEYKEYRPGKSKALIDEIDRIFGEYYSLTKEEQDFIINFDVGFRKPVAY
jgi:type I restriction-modification system DNA methylase subunit/predicted type IV restriction endonuclease